MHDLCPMNVIHNRTEQQNELNHFSHLAARAVTSRDFLEKTIRSPPITAPKVTYAVAAFDAGKTKCKIPPVGA